MARYLGSQQGMPRTHVGRLMPICSHAGCRTPGRAGLSAAAWAARQRTGHGCRRRVRGAGRTLRVRQLPRTEGAFMIEMSYNNVK